jgi:hypothetical protein
LWLNKRVQTHKSILLSFLLLLILAGHSSAAVESRQVDEISNFNWEDLMARLDFYAIELKNAPAASGHIIVYDGQRSRRDEIQGWIHCIKTYLVGRRGIEPNRITIVNGGHRRSKTVEMWLATPGDSPPKATPTFKPKDVKFRKGRLKKRDWGTLCNI